MRIQSTYNQSSLHTLPTSYLSDWNYLPCMNSFSQSNMEIQPFNFIPKQKKFQKNCFKIPIFQWFRSLSLKQRLEITQIKNEVLVNIIIQLFDQGSLEAIKISIDSNKSKKSQNQQEGTFKLRLFESRNVSEDKLSSEQKLLRNIRLVCLQRPSLFFNQTFLENVENILNCLNQISEKNIFKCLKQGNENNPKNKKQYDNPLWFSSYSFNSLGQWICSALEKSIVKEYKNRTKTMKIQKLISSSQNCLEISKQFIQFCCKNKDHDEFFHTKYIQYLQNWMSLSLGQKTTQQIKQFVKSAKNMYELFDEQKTNQLLQKQINKTNIHRKKSKRTNKNKRQFNKVILHEISLQNIQQNQIEIIQENQPIIEIFDKQCQISQIKNKDNTILQENNLSIAKQESIQDDLKFEEEPQNTQCSSTQNKQMNKSQNNQLGQILIHSEQDSIEQQKKRKHPQRKKKRLSDKVAQTLFDNWLDTNIQNFVDGLSRDSNKLFEAKILAFERIRHFTAALNPYNQIQGVLFGSNAIGLSLTTSDIDILLKGFTITNHEQLCQFMEIFSLQLKKMKWVVQCSIFPHAKIPIIKLLINLNYGFKETYCYGSELTQTLDSVHVCLDQNTPIETLISVDITIDIPYSQHCHLGMNSTQLMRNKLGEYDNLHELVMVLKYIFNKKGLNKTFKGGISSFGLFIFVISYIKQYNPKSLSSAILGLTKFYSSTFNNQKQSITYNENQSCFEDIDILNQPITQLTILNPLNKQSLTSNCTTFTTIKQELSIIHQKLLNVKQQMKEELSKLEPSQLKQYQEKKKCADKFIKKYQQTHKLKLILDGQ